MTQDRIHEYAEAFLQDYRDPEVDKRLWFDAWSTRVGLKVTHQLAVWGEVKHLTRSRARRRARPMR